MITVKNIQTLIERQLKSYDEQAKGQVVEVKQLIRAQQAALIELQQAIEATENKEAVTIDIYTDSLDKIITLINNAASEYDASDLAATYLMQKAMINDQVLNDDSAKFYANELIEKDAKFSLQTAVLIAIGES